MQLAYDCCVPRARQVAAVLTAQCGPAAIWVVPCPAAGHSPPLRSPAPPLALLHLHPPTPADVLKFFGIELGAQTKYDKKSGTSIVNGAHDASKLSELLESFIKK